MTHDLLNLQIKGNLDAIDQHTHSGSAGDGITSLANLVKATYADAVAPAAPGSGLTVFYMVSGRPFYRAGVAGASTQLADANDLHNEDHASRHDSGGGDAMAADAAAGTPSLRTLSTTSVTAAPGDHGH